MAFVQYLLAFVVTLGILVTVHEWGHFVVARRSGVKVLRFSIGFGPSLWSRTDRHGTQYVVAALPLGGYVRMLDERDGDVPPEDLPRSYRRLSPGWRIAIALGGPAANFLLAIVVFWLMFVTGRTEPVPVIDAPAPDTPAYAAGIPGGDEVVGVDGAPTTGWSDVALALAARLGDTGTIAIVTRTPGADRQREYRIPIEDWHRGEGEPDLLGSLGLELSIPAVLGDVLADGAAERAGLQTWDRVLSVDGVPVDGWAEWVEQVRAAPDKTLHVVIERQEERLERELTPFAKSAEDGTVVGYVGVAMLTRHVAYGPLDAIGRAVGETWAKTKLTLDLLKKMLLGLVSTKNLSGPITIAKVAGDSVSSGFEYFLGVLALLSISLGVLNLLPIPILDGGHVLFCLTEMVIRRPIPDRVQAIGVQIGLFVVSGLMVLAFYNDLTRLF